MERSGAADRVNAAEKAADPLAIAGRRELGPTSAAARKNGEAKSTMKMQSLAVSSQRCDHGNLVRRQLRRKGMLLDDGRVPPATGPVELGDHGLAALDSDLVDPILVAVESQHAPVAAIVEDLECVQYRFRRQAGKRRVHIHRCDSTGTMLSCRCCVP